MKTKLEHSHDQILFFQRSFTSLHSKSIHTLSCLILSLCVSTICWIKLQAHNLFASKIFSNIKNLLVWFYLEKHGWIFAKCLFEYFSSGKLMNTKPLRDLVNNLFSNSNNFAEHAMFIVYVSNRNIFEHGCLASQIMRGAWIAWSKKSRQSNLCRIPWVKSLPHLLQSKPLSWSSSNRSGHCWNLFVWLHNSRMLHYNAFCLGVIQ